MSDENKVRYLALVYSSETPPRVVVVELFPDAEFGGDYPNPLHPLGSGLYIPNDDPYLGVTPEDAIQRSIVGQRKSVEDHAKDVEHDIKILQATPFTVQSMPLFKH